MFTKQAGKHKASHMVACCQITCTCLPMCICVWAGHTAAGALNLLCCHNPKQRKVKSSTKIVFCLCQTGEAASLLDLSCRLSLLFILAFKDGSTVETKPRAESPPVVNAADRIRFNTALDFLSPQRKVRDGCRVFLRHPFVLLKIKRERDRYCVVKRNIKGSGQIAAAAGEDFVTRQRGPGILGAPTATKSFLTRPGRFNVF